MDVGGRIKKFRIAKNLKQSELADLLQVTAQAVSSWERNRTQPNMETIERMCEIFKCKKSDFLDEAPTSFDSPVELESALSETGDSSRSMELSDLEYKALLYFRALDPVLQDLALLMLKTFRASVSNDKKDTT